MKDTTGPAILPGLYRFAAPEPRVTVAGMKVAEHAVTSEMAIGIDSTFGVWIDPTAAVVIGDPDQGLTIGGESLTIRVQRLKDGYHVSFRDCAAKKWIPSMLESYSVQHFVPVVGIH